MGLALAFGWGISFLVTFLCHVRSAGSLPDILGYSLSYLWSRTCCPGGCVWAPGHLPSLAVPSWHPQPCPLIPIIALPVCTFPQGVLCLKGPLLPSILPFPQQVQLRSCLLQAGFQDYAPLLPSLLPLPLGTPSMTSSPAQDSCGGRARFSLPGVLKWDDWGPPSSHPSRASLTK